MHAIGKRLKAIRRARRLTLDELARRVRMTKGYLSRIEHASKPPPFSTLQAIAQALALDVMDLVKAPAGDDSPNIWVARNVLRKKNNMIRSQVGSSFQTLLPKYGQRYMTPFLVEVGPGKTSEFAHDAEEFVYILEGRLTLVYEDKRYPLAAGDCFYLDSRLMHRFENNHKRKAIMLAVDYNYRRF